MTKNVEITEPAIEQNDLNVSFYSRNPFRVALNEIEEKVLPMMVIKLGKAILYDDYVKAQKIYDSLQDEQLDLTLLR